jgi:hypothetical protein
LEGFGDGPSNITEGRNQAGCPYLNQTGADAVLDWANVLASIDRVSLPQSLQLELQQLQLQSGPGELAATVG